MHKPTLINGELGAGRRPPHSPRHARRGVAAVLLASGLPLTVAAALPFRTVYRAWTTAGEVRVFDGRRLWVRSQDDGSWRPQDLPKVGRLFDVGGEGNRLYLLDEGGVAVVTGGETLQRLPVCLDAGSLAVAGGTIWCASHMNSLGQVTVRRLTLDGKELHRWTAQVPETESERSLPEIARLAGAWWFLLADEQGAVGVSQDRPQLLVVPARGAARVVPWPSPLEALRQRRPVLQGTELRLPEFHLTAAVLLPDGDLLVLPGITDVDPDGSVSKADRLLIVKRDGSLTRSLLLPRPAIGIVANPGQPLVLYENNTLQSVLQLQSGPSSASAPQ